MLLIAPDLSGGGEERMAVHLANSFPRDEIETILALGAVEGHYLKDVRADVDIHCLGGRRARGVVMRLARLVRRLRPDAVISFLGFNFATVMARPFFPSGTRVILRHGSSTSAFLEDVARKNRAQSVIYRMLFHRLYRFADTIVCQCDFMMHDLVANFALPADKVVRIYNPVDERQIKKLLDGSLSPYEGDGPHLVSVGRLSHEKGHDLLLNAFQLVRMGHATATLTIVGEGPNHEKLELQAQQLNLQSVVQFIAFQSNPFPYMKHADLFVLPSRYEGFSFAVLESLACGTPVVATDCPGGTHEVLEEGFNGWMARSEDVESMAATIGEALVKLPTSDSEAIRIRCEERFSLEHITSLYEKLF